MTAPATVAVPNITLDRRAPSRHDSTSRWTAATREAAFYAYSTNYLIDLDHAVIVDVEATTSVRQAEVTAQRRMIERTQKRFGVWPGHCQTKCTDVFLYG